jgi:translation initiation factor IF-1
MKDKDITARGTVSESLPNALFRVALDNGHHVVAYGPRETGRPIAPGAPVTVEMSPLDLGQGRIRSERE